VVKKWAPGLILAPLLEPVCEVEDVVQVPVTIKGALDVYVKFLIGISLFENCGQSAVEVNLHHCK